jgi:ABC-type glycerol-3-phosphate transport system substrate-binding protein
MGKSAISRRRFLQLMGLSAASGALAACAGATPAQAPAATSAPAATPNIAATEAVLAAQATEAAIAMQARAEEEIFKMTAEQYAAMVEQNVAKALQEGKTVIEMLSAYGTIIEDKTQPHFWILRNFMQKHPEIYVRYSPSSAYTGAFNEVIMMRIASGDPPDCILHYSAPIAYAARGTCRPLDDLMDVHPVGNKDAWEKSALAQLQWNGKTWGVPLNGSQNAMFYNVEVLEARGISTKREDLPKTLDELLELSQALTEWDGDTLKVAGYTPFEGNWSWPGKMVANGGIIWDGEKYTINHEKNVELVEYWISWIDKLYKGDIDLLRAQGTMNNTYPEGAFGLGIQVVCDDGLWSLTHVPPERKYEVSVMPTGPSGTRHATSNWPNMMFIPTGAKHVKEAFELCVYYGTEGQIEWWHRWSDVPYWKDFPADVAPQDLIARVGEAKALELTRFAREYASEIVVQWNSPVEDFATDEIYRAVDSALHKQQSAKAALDAAQEIVSAKLQEVITGA